MNCPECGEPMSHLGGGLVDRYYHCFGCGISIPMKTESEEDSDIKSIRRQMTGVWIHEEFKKPKEAEGS